MNLLHCRDCLTYIHLSMRLVRIATKVCDFDFGLWQGVLYTTSSDEYENVSGFSSDTLVNFIIKLSTTITLFKVVFNANSKNLSMPYCRKTFEYEWFYLYSKNIQSECRPQLKKIMQHTDWTISEYEYETCTQKVPRDQVPQPIKTDLHNIFEIWTLTFFLYSGFLHKKS